MTIESNVDVVASYPDEGITVLEDNHGQFLMLKETDEIISLRDDTSPVFAQSARSSMYLS